MSPLNALNRYPEMPGHIWVRTPKHVAICERCGEERRTSRSQRCATRPRFCGKCSRIRAAYAIAGLLGKKPLDRK